MISLAILNPANYVQAGTKQMKLRVQFFDPANLLAPAWKGRVDMVQWRPGL
jgi:hypothetical protein